MTANNVPVTIEITDTTTPLIQSLSSYMDYAELESVMRGTYEALVWSVSGSCYKPAILGPVWQFYFGSPSFTTLEVDDTGQSFESALHEALQERLDWYRNNPDVDERHLS